jgi:hypothetical protein
MKEIFSDGNGVIPPGRGLVAVGSKNIPARTQNPDPAE